MRGNGKKDSFTVAIYELNLHVMQHTEWVLFKCATHDFFFPVHKTWILYLMLQAPVIDKYIFYYVSFHT